jgi:hypothetical protein
MADAKISALTELVTVADEDLLVIVDDPAGTPVTKKITRANLTSGLAELVIPAYPGQGALQAATLTVDPGGTLPVVQFADAANNRTWHIPIRIPSIANGKSISLVRIHYVIIGTTNRNLLVINSFYRYPVANDSALTSDNDGGVLYATGTSTTTNHCFIDVSSTAYNGIGAVSTGDLLMMQINRQGADASDTYGQNWNVLRVDFTFA